MELLYYSIELLFPSAENQSEDNYPFKVINKHAACKASGSDHRLID